MEGKSYLERKNTNASEEHIVSIFRVEEQTKQESNKKETVAFIKAEVRNRNVRKMNDSGFSKKL
jgi:hypothetical protein